MRYTVAEIAAITGGALAGGDPVTIQECSIDSRSLLRAAGTLFFALKGERHDGHDYIPALYAAGVRAFVVSDARPAFDALDGANFIRVPDVTRALQALAARHRRQSTAEFVGITGSNGKTIVKEWIHQLAPADWRLYRGPRSYNSQVGVPLSLLGIDDEDRVAVIEAGISRPGEMERLGEMIAPGIGIFTRLGEAHDENFASREEKLLEKARLFRSCRVIIGQEGEALDRLRAACPGARFLAWGEGDGVALRVTRGVPGRDGRVIEMRHGDEQARCTLPLADEASRENALHVACFLLLRGLPLARVAASLERLTPVAMRMEIKEGVNNCTLVNDFYNSDPTSFRLALQSLAFRDPGKERVVILTDFDETGRPPALLYREAGEAIRAAGVTRFIGIGEEITRHRDAFPGGSRFHETTGQFLRQEERAAFRDQLVLIKGARRFQLEYIAGFLQKQSHGTVLEVDLDAMTLNLNYFRSLTPARVAVMVKAFTYGSGAREVASLLQYHRVDYLMVAFADEGIELRAAGITLPVAVMNPEREAFDNMITLGLEPEIYALDLLDDFEQALARHGVKRFPVHVKLNTGMNRSGLDDRDIPALLDFFRGPRAIYIRSLFSHLAGSDDPVHDDFTRLQARRFEEMTARVQARFDYPIWRHLLNSAGIERFPEYHHDMVRLGIGLHGISAAGAPLSPVSTFTTRVAAVREIAAGEPVGYNRRGYTTRPSRVATLLVGYADGLDRRLGNGAGEVLVRGARVPFIGNICMDSCMIDVTGTGVTVGDEVEIFGKHLPVTEVAARLGTIPYEVLTGVSQRVKRVYYKE
ncbi:MAG: bifunctional UDP-N-acetylmuramoyl-tripeptide:D-alanyl-D-alanine ligase/alanine racemase [Odoribacteraceae bacterium]|jgi:alanine racemase|nr:bifunctional UDP-N-acetylmuramoyl-tripeptide:D-alanyl-D-alanine ligase/alanine racemase [Odoribacteraceae bacterium]